MFNLAFILLCYRALQVSLEDRVFLAFKIFDISILLKVLVGQLYSV